MNFVYKVLKGRIECMSNEFETDVAYHLNNGWSCVGGVYVTSSGIAYQAMVGCLDEEKY